MRELDGNISSLFPFFKRVIGDKTVDKTRKELLAKMNKVLLSSTKDPNKLNPIYKFTGKETVLNKAGIKNFQKSIKAGFLGDEKSFIGRLTPKFLKKFTEQRNTGIESTGIGS